MSQRPHQHEHLHLAAYFCMEFALHEEFPIYSGGLGVLAGDVIKSAGDLKLPLVAVGLFWNEGYTTQRIDADGRPYDEYPPCPAEHTRDTGVRISVEVAGEEVRCRVLLVDKYGNAPLYLLDPEAPEQRWITRRLYGGGARDRVAQEILLGVGGVRALRALGLPVTVYHFNEGHAVFAGLELMREHMQSPGAPLDFEAALEATRAVCVFTTHTPVPAGNETHPGELLRELGANLHLSAAELETLGGEPFGMTVAGLRLSRRANAVAALHGDTSRGMWKAVTGAAPITSITNGVHPGTWQDERIRGAMRGEDSMWDAHHALKRALVHEVWRRTGTRLDSGKLLIGFARRAAAYKRADLILRNSARIEQRLHSGDVQLLFSGKAHPKDDAGKEIVANLVAMARRYPGSVVFLENYDMSIGRLLTRGCDVWLNNPRRPLEASGHLGHEGGHERCAQPERAGWLVARGLRAWRQRLADRRRLRARGPDAGRARGAGPARHAGAVRRAGPRGGADVLRRPCALDRDDARQRRDGRGALLVAPHGAAVLHRAVPHGRGAAPHGVSGCAGGWDCRARWCGG